MEFIDEETRPRFLLQTRISSTPIPKPDEIQKTSKTLTLICISVSSLLIFLAFFSSFSQSQTLQFLLIWFSISLALGPFAPTSFTGGDIRVGIGEPLQPSDPDPTPLEESRKKIPNRRPKTQRSDNPYLNSPSQVPTERPEEPKIENPARNGETGPRIEEEREWDDEDFDLLKKQIAKHPVGAPRRWESIAEAFHGRHGLESVIKTAKSMAEKRSGGGDPFAQFLKQRKPLSKQLESVNGDPSPSVEMDEGDSKKESSDWSSGEDIALLNALKAFPKDASMRWEKIAAAVPGKSKACCVKRVAELKRDFRSSKT
ncbi:transcription factor MAMYB [Magnolia sinica]|uniref:transcription factor MAMYB n=1 Tax=Magnolia sinica TaxID=86752 RepID=UPI00265A3FBD|nr:transcription factor MAMYB [Magnolia sinica]